MDILVNDMKILIVDDSAMIRERLIRMLSSFDGVSVLGLTGDEDWEIIGGLNPDFVVLDIKLNKKAA